MSITSNLCCEETEPRNIHSPDSYKGKYVFIYIFIITTFTNCKFEHFLKSKYLKSNLFGCIGSQLQHMGSLHHARSFLSGTDSVVSVCGISCLVAYGVFVPCPGIKPVFPAMEGRFLSTGLPGKSHAPFNIRHLHLFLYKLLCWLGYFQLLTAEKPQITEA